MRRFALLLALLPLAAVPVAAAVLFGATVDRNGEAESGGRLFAIDPGTARCREVGPIRIDSKTVVGINGLAMHPTRHMLYGVTAEATPRLVTIDPRDGRARVIGTLGRQVADINFDRSGHLYAWVPRSNSLGTIDLKTGGLSLLKTAGLHGDEDGGLAIDGDGVAWIAASSGSLDTVDMRSGKRSGSLGLTGPAIRRIDALTVAPSGTLFGTVRDASARPKLASIDVDTGAMRLIGDLPEGLEGLALTPDASEAEAQRMRERLNVLAMLGIAVLVLVFLANYRVRRAKAAAANPRNES
jgi:hypothetical protein